MVINRKGNALRTIGIMLAMVVSSWALRGQDLAFTGDPDVAYRTARSLAFEGKRDAARDSLRLILKAYPGYTDVHTLLAKTYSWDGNFEEARKHFNRITSEDRKNREAWEATINNEVYSENYSTALGLTNKALLYLKEDEKLLALKAELERKIEAAYSDSGTTMAMKETKTEKAVYKNTVAFYSAADLFDVVYDPMYYSGIEFIHETKFGKIIPRINYSNRFDIDGIQYEIDLYPKLSKMFYGYLNYGYSMADTYPSHRMGAELYANLPKSIEASVGMRYLNFVDSQVSIYTGSVGIYRGNHYFSLRPYVTPRNNNTMGISGMLTARKYLKDANNYIGLNGGMGFMPEFRQFLANSTLIAETVLFVASQQVQLEYQFSLKQSPSLYRVHAGLTRQELIFAPGNYFWAISAGLRYQVRF